MGERLGWMLECVLGPVLTGLALGAWMYWGPGLYVVYPEQHAEAISLLRQLPPTAAAASREPLSIAEIGTLVDRAEQWAHDPQLEASNPEGQ